MKLLRNLVIAVLILAILPSYYIWQYLSLGYTTVDDVPQWVPEDGIWYCEELQMQLAFEKDSETYTIINGEKIICVWENNRGSTHLMVACMDEDSSESSWGEDILSCEYVELTENQFVVKEVSSGEEYIFVRLPPPSN